MVEPLGGGRKSRSERLAEIGFIWHSGAIKPSFEDRLDQCREFRRKHDHLKIPQPGKFSKEDQSSRAIKEERSFLMWAQRQRDEYRKFNENIKSSLDKIRIRKIEELGFDWEVGGTPADPRGARGKPKNHVAFNDRIAALREIKDKYGDCNDIKNLKEAGHPERSPLYQWMKAQRKAWKAYKAEKWSSLNPDRIELLNSVNFNFEPRKHYAAYGSKKADEGVCIAAGGDRAIGQIENQHPQHQHPGEDSSEETEDDDIDEGDDEPPRKAMGYDRYRVI